MRAAPHARGRRLTMAARLLAIVGLLMVWTAAPAAAQLHGDHVIDVPFDIGPLALKIAVLLALPAVAGFAMLRGFIGAPEKGTAAFVAVCAAVAVSMELLLASGFTLPPIVVPLALAAVGGPLYLAFADREAPALVRGAAPAVLLAAAVVAGAVFVRAWLATPPGADRGPILHTGMIVAYAGLAWLTLGLPRNRALRGAVLTVAAVLGVALVGAGTQVAALG
ncbi:DUF6239 family natural product biosynthesis protein [Actinokineospora sp. UTMC 2448]|uniref:DUF6239 family natural product biosynthesis protein n=1 Tax=Actinokineospora sp. UTMC 2448 TaxID=2268449 RepID=UPI002164170F|nr:DUF6239 family natural product biosynthesis protein [Actinokineospora sp. UTMC 2448]